MADAAHRGTHHLDHVVVVVGDLDVAADALEEVGFFVTGRSDHPYGTSNRLVMLDDTYLEFLSVTDRSAVPESGFARFVSDSIDAGRLGPRLIAFTTDDPTGERGRLLDAGFSVPEPLRFGRQAAMPDGTRRAVEFEVVVPELASLTVGGIYCRHLTPEAVWDPSTLEHPNGARRLTEVTIPDAGPEGWKRLAMLAGASAAPPIDLSGVCLLEGAAQLVVEGTATGRASVDGTVVEVRSSPDASV